MQHKKFMDIQRIKEDITENFEPGDFIYIEEKLDGANAAIRYAPEADVVIAQSRKQILSPTNNLRGFYEFTQKLDIDNVKAVLGGNLVVFGEWLCLSGDTVIRKTSAGKNNNYMTLREMYEYRHKPCPDRVHHQLDRGRPYVIKNIIDYPNISDTELFNKHCNKYYANFKRMTNWLLSNEYITYENDKYNVTSSGIDWYNHYIIGDSWWDRYGMPSLFSLDFKSDKIVPNKMLDIVYTGNKEVYKLTTRKGFSIKATAEHPFLTPKGFVQLKDLKLFDCVAVTNLHNQIARRRFGKGQREIQRRMDGHKAKICKCEHCGSINDLELHHIDGNYLNNDISNYMVLCSQCHQKIHGITPRFKGVEYNYEFDYIVSINCVGIEDCYDIAMSGDETTANFVANGFIVHNCKHSVEYPEDKYSKFYAFDVYDTETESYLPQKDAIHIANQLNLMYVPIFYVGEFVSWEQCMEYVGRTNLGGEYGEGIVIKNQTKLNDPNTRQPFYLKIVAEKFVETKTHKSKKPKSAEELQSRAEAEAIVKSIVTDARVTKILHKFVDEGILPEKWGAPDMSIVAKNLPKAVYEDCLKEEPDTVKSVVDFGKISGNICMRIARTKI